MLVHQRPTGLAPPKHVGDDRQLLELDLDARRQILRLRPRLGHAHRHQLADMPHLAVREDRLKRRLEPRQRRIRPDRAHARQISGDEHPRADIVGYRNALDARVRDRTAQERHLQHPRQPDIPDEPPAPAHIALVLLARQPRADTQASCQFRQDASTCGAGWGEGGRANPAEQ